MVRTDDHVHLTSEANARDGHFEGPHMDAGGLDGQVIAANRQEIQSNAALRVARIRCRDCVECPVQTTHGVAEQKVDASIVLERITEVRALQLVPRKGSAEGRLMPLLVLLSDELL